MDPSMASDHTEVDRVLQQIQADTIDIATFLDEDFRPRQPPDVSSPKCFLCYGQPDTRILEPREYPQGILSAIHSLVKQAGSVDKATATLRAAVNKRKSSSGQVSLVIQVLLRDFGKAKTMLSREAPSNDSRKRAAEFSLPVRPKKKVDLKEPGPDGEGTVMNGDGQIGAFNGPRIVSRFGDLPITLSEILVLLKQMRNTATTPGTNIAALFCGEQDRNELFRLFMRAFVDFHFMGYEDAGFDDFRRLQAHAYKHYMFRNLADQAIYEWIQTLEMLSISEIITRTCEKFTPSFQKHVRESYFVPLHPPNSYIQHRILLSYAKGASGGSQGAFKTRTPATGNGQATRVSNFNGLRVSDTPFRESQLEGRPRLYKVVKLIMGVLQLLEGFDLVTDGWGDRIRAVSLGGQQLTQSLCQNGFDSRGRKLVDICSAGLQHQTHTLTKPTSRDLDHLEIGTLPPSPVCAIHLFARASPPILSPAPQIFQQMPNTSLTNQKPRPPPTMTALQKQRQLADALARICAIGIENLLDSSIQPRHAPNAARPNKKALLDDKETGILLLEAYPPKLINQLDTLHRIMRDSVELKRQVLAEVRARQEDPRHPQQRVREVMARDLGAVIGRHNFARAAERKRRLVDALLEEELYGSAGADVEAL
ncbi:uncharacterized protein J3D65DRAFT_607273 [Phyllosticta citribraziliensis]|uniref:Uncharacterized protein n=1 Tax=Phyllosticta citribraziliensis TaxID=989973 RepID=A0ABR1L4Q2_9PEZI